jgi:hypothetical protein
MGLLVAIVTYHLPESRVIGIINNLVELSSLGANDIQHHIFTAILHWVDCHVSLSCLIKHRVTELSQSKAGKR